MADIPVFPERPRVALACACILGEAPMWDWRTGTLHFVDIKGQVLWRWRPGQDPVRIEMPEPVTFVKLTADPDVMILGLKSGLGRFRSGDAVPDMILRPEASQPGNRLNDAGVGPDGSLHFGSMDDSEKEPTGRYYRWSDRGLEPFGYAATVTNGPTVDGLRRVIYTADTQKGRIYRHAMAQDGTPDDGELFAAFGEGEGYPDGLTVDAEGHLWVCHFGGARITRYAPDGRPVLIVPVPTAQVTKLAFGGPDLTTIYVTTASIGRDRSIDLLAGDLLTFDVGIAGLQSDFMRVPEAGIASL